ncbi:hemerythrin domain-containing protein [Streptomyces sp. R21]|uniref:Hemerythrin domain-containing protein n=1 Tax=Streptomyces sp. R21 TaxID=3238627 RepID=A0AB39PQK4_9ACTN
MGHGGNVIKELTADHEEVEELFGKIEALPPGEKSRKVYADRVTMEFVRHWVAEKAYLYPAVRQYLDNGDAVADKEIDDQSKAERIMKDLESHEADDAEFDRLVGLLMNEIRWHIAEEEENLFPKLSVAAPAGALDDLGEKVRQAKKTAPARPGPAAADKPPA